MKQWLGTNFQLHENISETHFLYNSYIQIIIQVQFHEYNVEILITLLQLHDAKNPYKSAATNPTLVLTASLRGKLSDDTEQVI
jgi:hypothetical protein